MRQHLSPCPLILGTVLALATAAAVAAQGPDKSGDVVCTPPPFAPEPGGLQHALLTGIPIQPGQTVPTAGTNLHESPELSKFLIFKSSRSFSSGQAVSVAATGGELRQRVYGGDDGHCKCQWQVAVAAGSTGCVAKLRITNVFHPLDIVADWRDDQNGSVASDVAHRSTDGLVFDFRLPTLVCGGEVSRWLLLNMSIDLLAKKGTVQLLDSADMPLVPPIPTYVPK